jgi:hypothetical protein
MSLDIKDKEKLTQFGDMFFSQEEDDPFKENESEGYLNNSIFYEHLIQKGTHFAILA